MEKKLQVPSNTKTPLPPFLLKGSDPNFHPGLLSFGPTQKRGRGRGEKGVLKGYLPNRPTDLDPIFTAHPHKPCDFIGPLVKRE